MSVFLRDCKIGFRHLIKYRKYSVIVLLTMILGVSVTTTMMTVANQVILQPLPAPQPENLFSVVGRNANTGEESDSEWVNFPLFRQWQDLRLDQLDLAFFTYESTAITETDIPVYAASLVVSQNFLSVLGIQPVYGRWFNADDVGQDSVLITEDIWREQFSMDPNIVGKAISLEQRPHTILGIMPENFSAFVAPDAVIFRPVDNFFRGGEIIGRTKVAVNPTQLEYYTSSLTLAALSTNPNVNVELISLHSQLTKPISSKIWLLVSAVIALLFVAVLNVTNLTFAYYNNRLHELSIRVALGSTRIRLIRQLLVEQLLLAIGVGLASMFLSMWLLDIVLNTIFSSLPRHEEIQIDFTTWVFSFGIALFATLLAALIPSLKMVDPEELAESIKQASGRSTGALKTIKIRKFLVAIEVGFALILLIAVGLLLRSYINLLQQNTGFNPIGVMTAHIWASRGYQQQDRINYYQNILRNMGDVPGVTAAAATSTLPLGPSDTAVDFTKDYTFPGQQILQSGYETRASMRSVSDDYFRILEIPLLEGRYFDERERSSDVNVAIINKTLAEFNWPDESAVGKEIHIPSWRSAVFQIIGVVQDNRHKSLDAEINPEMFISLSQYSFGGATFVAKTEELPSAQLKQEMMKAAAEVDNSVPMIELHSLTDLIHKSVEKQRTLLQLLLGFSLVTILLSVVGIYGLSNYLIGQRIPEIAVRMAVGAKPKSIWWMVLKDAVMPAILGIAIGLLASAIIGRLLSSFLFGVQVWDVTTYLIAVFIILAVGVLSPVGPALRASRTSPSVALHHQ